MQTQDLDALIQWYEQNHRRLPWRETMDGYAVMVSEFMLQQTTVAAVEPKYREWLRRFPDFQTLAAADESAVFSQWSGLGYYQRAKRLHQVAREVASLGYLPDTFEELLSLPGVGPYTAAAVSSICFGRPALAVDTNVIRVLFRYYAISQPAQSKAGHDVLRRNMESFLESRDPGHINQALMELGATVCSVKNPGCLLCPLSDGCKARTHDGGPGSFPLATAKKKARKTPGKAFVITESEGKSTLLIKGTSLGLLSPLYQPPILFSEQESEETFSQSVLSIAESLPPAASPGRVVKYGISGRQLILECLQWELKPSTFDQLKKKAQSSGLTVRSYQPREEDERVPLSTLTRKILQKCQGSP